MGLSEMMCPTSLDNISEKEAYFDLLIPYGQQKHVQDPNPTKTNRYTQEQGKITHFLVYTLVPWKDSYWKNKFLSLLNMGYFYMFRVKFRLEPYSQPRRIVDEINEGIRR